MTEDSLSKSELEVEIAKAVEDPQQQEPELPVEELETPTSQADLLPEVPVPLHGQGKRAGMADWMILVGTWMIAFSLVLFAVYVGWRTYFAPEPPVAPEIIMTVSEAAPASSAREVVVPIYSAGATFQAVRRLAQLHTIVPNRPRQDVVKYTVVSGDSVFEIAKNFNIKPETVLWANYDLLNDSPEALSPGMELNIPPVDGVYYQWQEGDTIQDVAARFKTTLDAVVNWPGNKLDLTDPNVSAEQWVMLPNGEREFRSWVVPQIARGSAGVSKSVYGPGACEGNYEGVYGSGGFIWPTASHVLSGNDFWSGHLGIDIAAGLGDPVAAADSGVVVFAGWSTGGYGYMVMIDHGTGYQTVYAHLSSVGVSCGQSVYQGGYVGGTGSTGNSTGTHLHFEVRLAGAFVNPWHVLP